jgi:putative addiction module component (TIGR02574 family)
MVTARLLDEVLKLSADERLELVSVLWGSLQIEDAFPMTEERIRESELRLEDHRANPASSISWAEAKKRLGLV